MERLDRLNDLVRCQALTLAEFRQLRLQLEKQAHDRYLWSNQNANRLCAGRHHVESAMKYIHGYMCTIY